MLRNLKIIVKILLAIKIMQQLQRSRFQWILVPWQTFVCKIPFKFVVQKLVRQYSKKQIFKYKQLLSNFEYSNWPSSQAIFSTELKLKLLIKNACKLEIQMFFAIKLLGPRSISIPFKTCKISQEHRISRDSQEIRLKQQDCLED